jgi:hypothetical protein
MGARLGKNPKRASTVSELTASACGDATRLVFVRSDLLLHTTTGGDFNAVRRCDGFTNLQVFVARAVRDADVLVLGLGHHVRARALLMTARPHSPPSQPALIARPRSPPSLIVHSHSPPS